MAEHRLESRTGLRSTTPARLLACWKVSSGFVPAQPILGVRLPASPIPRWVVREGVPPVAEIRRLRESVDRLDVCVS